MDSQLTGNILRSSDDYLYHRYGADAKKTKLYLKCIKYRWGGCLVNIQTSYTDKTIDHVRVFHKNGSHKHFPSRESLEHAQSLSIINSNSSKIWQSTPARYLSGSNQKMRGWNNEVSNIKIQVKNHGQFSPRLVIKRAAQEKKIKSPNQMVVWNRPLHQSIQGLWNLSWIFKKNRQEF